MKKQLYILTLLLFCFSNQAFVQRYYKTQTHCHTTNSDGSLSPAALIDAYKNKGYEVVFFTDHNFATDGATYSLPDILAITGNEYTFQQHINGLFQTHTVDATDFHAQQAIDSIKVQGGLAMLNHPIVKIPYNWWLPSHEIAALNGLGMIEIYNAGTETYAQDDYKLWDSLLTMGVRLWGVASDDLHETSILGVQMIDRGYIMLYMNELTENSVYDALENGNFYASTGVELTHYYLDNNTIHIGCIDCSKISFIGENQTNLATVNGQSATYTITNEMYVRVFLEGSGWGFTKKRAWTQAIYSEDLIDNTNIISFNKNKCNFELFPNPIQEFTTVKFEYNAGDIVYIEVFDLLGQHLKLKTFEDNVSSTQSIKVDLGDLNKGFYLLRFCKNANCETKKINKL